MSGLVIMQCLNLKYSNSTFTQGHNKIHYPTRDLHRSLSLSKQGVKLSINKQIQKKLFQSSGDSIPGQQCSLSTYQESNQTGIWNFVCIHNQDSNSTNSQYNKQTDEQNYLLPIPLEYFLLHVTAYSS